jgi:hypothetical protein
MRGTSIFFVAIAGGALALAGAAQAQLIEHGVAGTQAGGGQLNGALNAPLTPGNPDTQTTAGTATRIPAHKHSAKVDPDKAASSASGAGADTAASAGGAASTSGAGGTAGASVDAGAKSTTGGQSDTTGAKSNAGAGGPH